MICVIEMRIFGVQIDALSRQDLLERSKRSVEEKTFFRIATVNPEFLLEAGKNRNFLNSLSCADARVRDGFGVGFAYFLSGKKAPIRICGADLLCDLLLLAEKNEWTVFVVNRKDGLSLFSEIRKAVLQEYPYLKMSGGDFDVWKSGSMFRDKNYIISQIKEIAPHFVFCTFGAPEQEFFLEHVGKKGLPVVAMGVGGSFDYLTGKQKRAPKWMQRAGLEWLVRPLLRPKRIFRIFRSVFAFPFFALVSRLREISFQKCGHFFRKNREGGEK